MTRHFYNVVIEAETSGEAAYWLTKALREQAERERSLNAERRKAGLTELRVLKVTVQPQTPDPHVGVLTIE